MTPKERIIAVLRNKPVDWLPFTIYDTLLPRGLNERLLRNIGVSLINKQILYESTCLDAKITRLEYKEKGICYVRDDIATPKGNVYQVFEKKNGSLWKKEFFIKSAEDYAVMEYFVKNTTYYPAYDRFHVSSENMGEDGLVAACSEATPMQKLMLYWIGMERFSYDFYDMKERVLSLCDALEKKDKESWLLLASSPAEVIFLGDSISADMAGADRFARYYVPSYNRYVKLLGEAGKTVAVHMDGKLNGLKESIKESDVEVIEGFTPPPEGDISLQEALRIWKRKIIWLNFPSSVFLASDGEVARYTMEMLGEGIPVNRVIFGITEDIPGNALMKMRLILDIINKWQR